MMMMMMMLIDVRCSSLFDLFVEVLDLYGGFQWSVVIRVICLRFIDSRRAAWSVVVVVVVVIEHFVVLNVGIYILCPGRVEVFHVAERGEQVEKGSSPEYFIAITLVT